MSILKFIAACSAAFALACAPAAQAAQEQAKPKATAKKSTKAAKSKAKPAAAAAAPDPDADEPDVTASAVTDYNCELGNKISIYQNVGDDGHIALRWKQRLHRLTRVATTTGAQRFENKFHGLIWIGIPAKGMLLDAKQNRQLANECRNAEQMKPMEMPPVQTSAAPAAPQPQL